MNTKKFTLQNSALLISQPPKCDALLMLAHGAGSPMDSTFMESITQALYKRNIGIIRFEFDYMEQRRAGGNKRPPPKMPALVNEWQKRLLQWRQGNYPLPLFIGGKSMGARVATLMNTVTENTQTHNALLWQGVICLGYPFHPQKQPLKLRIEHLHQQIKPVLIIQGARDTFGNQEEVSQYKLKNNIEIRWINSANHDLKPLVSANKTHQDAINEAAQSIKCFISQNVRLMSTGNLDYQ